MNKMIFSDNTEMEIADATQMGDSLTVTVNTADANSVIEKFGDVGATSVMRYYVERDLMRGYSGFTKLQKVEFQPDVLVSVDYSVTDPTTESGFKEEKTDKCIVTMAKQSLVASVAHQTAQNTANIDYLAMETGVSL